MQTLALISSAINTKALWLFIIMTSASYVKRKIFEKAYYIYINAQDHIAQTDTVNNHNYTNTYTKQR